MLVLLLATGASAQAAGCAGFPDVADDNSESCKAIKFAKSSGWISGYPDGTFRPQNSINRAEFTKIMVNASNLQGPIDERTCVFPDVLKSDWFFSYVCKAQFFGIIKGKWDGNFHPQDAVNVAEGIKIILRSMGFSGIEDNAKWYGIYVDELKKIGIDTESSVSREMTREAAAWLIMKIKEKNQWFIKNSWSNWKNSTFCDAKQYPTLLPSVSVTCRQRWQSQKYYELGYPILRFNSEVVRRLMDKSVSSHEGAKYMLDAAGVLTDADSTKDVAKNILKEAVKRVGVKYIGDKFGNVAGIVADIAFDDVEAYLSAAKGNYWDIVLGQGMKVLGAVNDVVGSLDLTVHTKDLNNINIAISYLDDFYMYGGDDGGNGRVATNIAKVSYNSDMYATITGYANNKGYKNSYLWVDDYNAKTIVNVVEEIKEIVRSSTVRCYDDGACLSQPKNILKNKDSTKQVVMYGVKGKL